MGILREVHNTSSDPLNRLIGESNETEVILENEVVPALIDSGAVISQITSQLAKELNLEVQKLDTILPLEGCAGIAIPYLGYVEARLRIPQMKSFEEECLFLVMPDHNYRYRVPVMISTKHIDMIISQATPAELEQMSITWGRGQLFRKLKLAQARLEGYLAQCSMYCRICHENNSDSESSDEELLIA